jgi:hypothetical protein
MPAGRCTDSAANTNAATDSSASTAFQAHKLGTQAGGQFSFGLAVGGAQLRQRFRLANSLVSSATPLRS